MKFFIDSADIDEITQAFEWGLAQGVTTNPSLIMKAVQSRDTGNLAEYLTKILEVAGEGHDVSLEVIELTFDGMVAQGKALYERFNPIAGNVVIKVPINPAFKPEDTTQSDGLRTIEALTKAGIPVNTTLVFTPEQGLLAANAGARYISPFAGRVDDYILKNAGLEAKKGEYFPAEGRMHEEKLLSDNGIVSGIDLTRKCVQILAAQNLETSVLAASLRNIQQVRESAIVGAQYATVPFGVIKGMLEHPKTYEGMEAFTRDIQQVPDYAKLTEGAETPDK